jgi:hypothetical protein
VKPSGTVSADVAGAVTAAMQQRNADTVILRNLPCAECDVKLILVSSAAK